MFTNTHDHDWLWADDAELLFESEDDELTGDDFDWDIGSKGGEVEKSEEDESWDSIDYRRQYLDSSFDEFAPSGYQYDDEQPHILLIMYSFEGGESYGRQLQ